MRMIPSLVVIDPCDATEIAQATAAIAAHDGPVYMRLLRGTVPVVLDPESYRFEIGKAVQLRSGGDFGIVSTGLMTERALDAADVLEREGIRTGVLHVPTIKPFDAAAVANFAASVDRLATAENHVVAGGLASLVAESLFDAGLFPSARPRRSARPLHRMRRRTHPAAALRNHDRDSRCDGAGEARCMTIVPRDLHGRRKVEDRNEAAVGSLNLC